MNMISTKVIAANYPLISKEYVCINSFSEELLKRSNSKSDINPRKQSWAISCFGSTALHGAKLLA